ncbi:MAG: PD-(D/E)XK nuclease family protein, partial [Syntrophomonadaceae bacterium]|nr:PD-(D/E)XK nuclease family protein [Syntrophomonadaceae bacterium]
MQILFGFYLDGAVWSHKSASIGEVRTGPLGLLSILETRLGLSGQSVHPVKRIDEYMKRIAQVDNESAWFHNSFLADPWSTARQLLEWRDELVENGWQGKISGSPRLTTLNVLENVNIPLSAGRADRLQAVINQLELNHTIQIASLYLVEPMEMLPPVWKQLLNLLQKQGTSIQMWENPVEIDLKNNLTSTQSYLLSDSHGASLSAEDDSLILLKADNEWEAAEHLALWLASDPDANNEVTIICGSDTSILDQALKRHGLPILGRTEASRWREVQQVLPLMLANAWKPVDLRLLVELLSMTSSPLPNWVCRTLLKAINQEPGVGGKAWNEALEGIMTRRKEELEEKGDPKNEEKARAYAKEINSLLVEERFEPKEGITEENLRKRCQKVIEWLSWKLGTDPILVEVVGQARQLQELSLGKGRIPRNTLERMLDTIIGAGSYADDICEEAASWHVVDHPGQVADKCGEIIWWGFNDPMTKPPNYWTDQERNDLLKAGVQIEKTRDFRSREANAWKQGFMNTEKRFIGIYIVQLDGDEAYHHPFWDTICVSAAKAGNNLSEDEVHNLLVRDCNNYGNFKEWGFAARQHTLITVPDEKPAEYIAVYNVPPSVIKAPSKLSYSQMGNMIACPMKWALQYHAGLRISESQTVPSGNKMIGTFCHRIVEELYTDTSKQWSPNEAADEVGRLYDDLLPSMASELLLEGNTIEKQRYRAAIIEAVQQLIEVIDRMGLKVEKTEAPLQAMINDTSFIGYADLVLRDKEGHPFVLDMKWSNTSKYYQQEVKEGNALQLATYAWMLRTTETAQEVHTGYYMLAQGQIISDSALLAEEPIDSPRTLEEIWNIAVSAMNN